MPPPPTPRPPVLPSGLVVGVLLGPPPLASFFGLMSRTLVFLFDLLILLLLFSCLRFEVDVAACRNCGHRIGVPPRRDAFSGVRLRYMTPAGWSWRPLNQCNRRRLEQKKTLTFWKSDPRAASNNVAGSGRHPKKSQRG